MMIEEQKPNVGNMKSWLVPTFQNTITFDGQFFILRVIGCLFYL